MFPDDDVFVLFENGSHITDVCFCFLLPFLVYFLFIVFVCVNILLSCGFLLLFVYFFCLLLFHITIVLFFVFS